MEKKSMSKWAYGTIFAVALISFSMQETLHTISPMTSGLDPRRSNRAVVIIIIGVIVVVGVIAYTLYQKKHDLGDRLLTAEEKASVIADMKKNGQLRDPGLTSEQKQNIIKAQSEVVASTPSLTPEQKAEIIKQINTR